MNNNIIDNLDNSRKKLKFLTNPIYQKNTVL